MIFPFISLIYILNCLPSGDIWNKILEYNKTNMTVINNNNYFFFQESDYCNKNKTEMENLYEKQKSFFEKWETANYILIVDNFNEREETISDAAFHLSQYFYNELNVKMEKSVLALFSIKTRKIRIRTGEITKKQITDKEAQDIISSLGDLLREEKYYEAFLKYYELLDYDMDHSNTSYLIYYIFFGAFGAFVILFTLICIIPQKIKKCYYLPDEHDLRNIVSFLKAQKTNKKIFTENCVICLNKLIKESEKQKEEKKEDIKINLIEDKEDEISILNCGHQFHTKCIIKWHKIKNNCPICRQVILKEEDNNKIVWNIQTELYPRYNSINYDHLYTRGFYDSSSSFNFSSNDNNYSSNYSYGGGADCGGGATGGW